MIKSTMSVKHKFCIFCCIIFISWMNATSVVASISQGSPADEQFTDSLYFRVADSTYSDLGGIKAIGFTIQIYRPNEWTGGDLNLGDFDLYFSYNSRVFNPEGANDPIVVFNEDIVKNGSTLLQGTTRFHAGRYAVQGRAENAAGTKYSIPLGVDTGWIDLCTVSIPVSSEKKDNPEIHWDITATGAMTVEGRPIISILTGDVNKNPAAFISADGLVVTPEKPCQGNEAYIYVNDAATSGKGLTYAWSDSIAGDPERYQLGEFDISSTSKTGKSKDGRYEFEILGEGDTLLIRNTTSSVDGMFFFCVLSDESLVDVDSVIVDSIKVELRDSLYGYFASSLTPANHGMKPGIDTVAKCHGMPATVNLYFFGPSKEELDQKELGDSIRVYFAYQDSDFNDHKDVIKIGVDELLHVIAADNDLGKDLFVYQWDADISGRLHIESIGTSFCTNGVSYSLYDTVLIKEVEGKIEVNLEPITIGLNETIGLDTATVTPKLYTIKLQEPSLTGTSVLEVDGVNQYTSGDVNGVDTLIYTTDMGECIITAKRSVEVVEHSYLTIKVLLEGPYLGRNPETGVDSMRCEYASREDLDIWCFPRKNEQELISPYDDKCILDKEIKKISDIKTERTICDWVYIELQDVIRYTTTDGIDILVGGLIVDSVSAFVLSNGDVCNIHGEALTFENKGDSEYFVRVKHRNHLMVVSMPVQLPLKPNDAVYVVDFSVMEEVYKGDEGLVENNGSLVVRVGDVNYDEVVQVSDMNIIKRGKSHTAYYLDIDHDVSVTSGDSRIAQRNMGKSAKIP